MGILPDMHRSDTRPEWESVPPSEWNEHQRRAAETNGLDTPGNRLTLLGGIETLGGLKLINKDNVFAKAMGTVLIGAGRYHDLEDGKAADRTGTKSPLGEAFDAGMDTALAFAASLSLRKKGIVPQKEADNLLALTVVKSVASASGKALGREMHTSRAGKYGTFAHWSAVGLYCVSSTLEAFGAVEKASSTKRLARGAMKVGIGLGAVSAAGYARDVLAPKTGNLQ